MLFRGEAQPYNPYVTHIMWKVCVFSSDPDDEFLVAECVPGHLSEEEARRRSGAPPGEPVIACWEVTPAGRELVETIRPEIDRYPTPGYSLHLEAFPWSDRFYSVGSDGEDSRAHEYERTRAAISIGVGGQGFYYVFNGERA